MRKQIENQSAALQKALDSFDEAQRRELATKADVREAELRLQKEIVEVRFSMMKWFIGTAIAIVVPVLAALAKGFHWFGF